MIASGREQGRVSGFSEILRAAAPPCNPPGPRSAQTFGSPELQRHTRQCRCPCQEFQSARTGGTGDRTGGSRLLQLPIDVVDIARSLPRQRAERPAWLHISNASIYSHLINGVGAKPISSRNYRSSREILGQRERRELMEAANSIRRLASIPAYHARCKPDAV